MESAQSLFQRVDNLLCILAIQAFLNPYTAHGTPDSISTKGKSITDGFEPTMMIWHGHCQFCTINEF